jgi:hypothetical protein
MKLSSQLFKLSGSFIDGFTGGLNYSRLKVRIFRLLLLIKKQNRLQLCDLTYLTLRPIRAYAGAIFRTETARDLSGYDALTFWAGNSSRFNKRNWLRTRFPREQVSGNDKPAVN